MLIDTKRRVWLFSLASTLVSLIVSEVMNVAIFPRELLMTTMSGTVIIVITAAMPISLFIGSKMLENARLSAELQNLVNRDRLTNLATRDYFFQQMSKKPNAYGVSLMVDIDRFKRINDTYGHFAGDAVIQAVANTLQLHTRGDDIVCRFGGEEFMVFLSEHSRTDGYAAAERLRQQIADDLVTFDGETIGVTVSIGGSLKEQIEDISKAIRDADVALYRAKNLGRNQTVFVDDNERLAHQA